jgi:hypothetical protein
MKKNLVLSLAICGVLAATTVSAETSFGAVGFTDGGAGAYLGMGKFVTTLVVQNNSAEFKSGDATLDVDSTNVKLSTAYRLKEVGATSVLVGASYAMRSGDIQENGIDSFYQVALTAGIEHAFTPNVRLLALVDVVNMESYELDNGLEADTTTIFGNGRVGVAYVF